MTDVHGLAVQAVALKALADRVAERLEEVKAELAEAIGPGDRTAARLNDGTKVGTVTYTNAAVRARVLHPGELSRWVQANYPDEIVPVVRPSFEKLLLDTSKKAGQPCSPDGEVDVPGIEVYTGRPYLTIRPEGWGLTAAWPKWVEVLTANAERAISGGEVARVIEG
jgi:hypothetical protein